MTNGTGDAVTNITTFFVGFVAGIGTGLLLAPQSGARTRRQLHNLAEDLEERTSSILADAKGSIGKAIEQGKRLVG
ncbi:MAG: YtxH domain-containing protein [Nitrospiraceae bacterium]